MIRKEFDRLVTEVPETPCYEVWGRHGHNDAEYFCSAYFESEDAEEEVARLQYAAAKSSNCSGQLPNYWIKETTLGEYAKKRRGG